MLFLRETILNRLLPLCGLIAILTFTASCDSDSKGGGTSTDPGGTTVLFEDDFASISLATAWTPTIYGGGAIGIDSGTGQPAPSLYIQSDSTWVAQSLVVLSQPYSNVGGVSFTIQAQIDNPGSADKILDAIRITIHDQGRNSSQGVVTISRYQVGSDNVNISYAAYPAGYPWQQVKESNLALSPGFHEFKFVVYPDGKGKWFRDGIQRLATVTGAQLAEADLQLHLNVRGVDAAAHFDNALVSR
ncbi:MAG: hypothetical protein IID63_07595 [candidate division Zixibacteria bacterium]|nr:hypothetical protein [candidate division Zixibacteria bacterium]